MLAVKGVAVPRNEGVTCGSGEETINFMGKFAKEGMRYTDLYLCRNLYEKQNA